MSALYDTVITFIGLEQCDIILRVKWRSQNRFWEDEITINPFDEDFSNFTDSFSAHTLSDIVIETS